jgi:hypothetical protein
MTPADVLFVGGDVVRLASVKIRCREIASRLGCDVSYMARSAAELPKGYKAYVCVKPELRPSELTKLARQGQVIWDILDDNPPTEGVDTYIASTEFVRRQFAHHGREIRVIPHYHCNFEGVLNDGRRRNAAYIGGEHWYPRIDGVPHDRYFVCRSSREDLVPIYLGIGIAINLRRLSLQGTVWEKLPPDATPAPVRHIVLNSGMKLINCMGFGIPSVSGIEPAYLEIAPDCTIFTDQLTCGEHVRQLATDESLYQKLRDRCIQEARRYSVDAVVGHYRDLISKL